jgi:predicted Zn-dependent protease
MTDRQFIHRGAYKNNEEHWYSESNEISGWAHEVGHWFGMGHNYRTGRSVMAYSASPLLLDSGGQRALDTLDAHVAEAD